MNVRSNFEDMIQQYFPNPDLTRDPEYPEFYRDQSIQTSWVGFSAFHSLPEDTTKGADDNYEKDNTGNSENVGAG